jgi:hypothetical protein
MRNRIFTDGDFDTPRYPDADWSSHEGFDLGDPWSDRAVAEREAILRRWAEVAESYRQLRRLREPLLDTASATTHRVPARRSGA